MLTSYFKSSQDLVYIGGREETYLVHDILQQELLVFNGQTLRRHNFGFDDQNHDRVFRGASTVNPITTRIKLSPHDLDVLSQLRDNVGICLEEV